jgi:predicted small metal-binding protein
MKKILRCRDLGERTCNYLVTGDSTEDVERKMLDHTANKHPMFLESLDQEERERFMEQMDAMTENQD